MINKDLLLPCPFCGNEPHESIFDTQHSISCLKCFVSMDVVWCNAVDSTRYNSLSRKEYKSSAFKKECRENIRNLWNTRFTKESVKDE